MPVSIIDIARSRGVSALTPEEFERVDLPSACQCFVCAKHIPLDGSFPAERGQILCAEHIGGRGFRTTDQFEKYLTVYSLHKQAGGK